ncbi:MAG: hypothetical protein ACO1N5_09795 [Noviherbaspirillum sp.]
MKNGPIGTASLSSRGSAVWRWLGTAMLCLMLGACGGGGASDDTSGEAPDPASEADIPVPGPVKGQVTLNAPVIGAVVSLQTHDGQALAGTAVTDEDGRFEIPATEVRKGLRIVAMGGNLPDGTPVGGTLSTYVQPFNADGFGKEITAVSTLYDRLRIAGSLDVDTAAIRMASYLQLNPGRSPYSGYTRTNDFNSSIFLLAVAGSGLSFDAFMDGLVSDALADAESQRIFTGGLQLAPLGTAVAMGLVKGAAAKAGGTAMGSILSGIGIGNGDHAAVMARLALIEDKLDEVKGTLIDAVARIANVQIEMKQQNLETQINQVLTLMESLQTIDRYTGQERIDRQQEIEEEILTLSLNRQLIARVLDGKLGRGALIQSYADSLKLGQRFYSVHHYQRLVDFVEYFDSINIQLYYLLIEAYRSQETRSQQAGAPKSNQTRIELLVEELEAGRNSYLKRIPPALPDATTFIHTGHLRMWHGSRSYYVHKDKWPSLPAAVAAKGGWRIPDEATASATFSQTERRKIDGNTFALQQGAPLKLFSGGGMKIWTTKCANLQPLGIVQCWVWLFADDNPMRLDIPAHNLTKHSAHYMVWRPMERPEAAMYLPWLYAERPN